METGSQSMLPGFAADAVGQLLEWYREELKALNRSAKTIQGYLEVLARFFSYLYKTGQSKPVDKIGPADVKSYIRHLQGSRRWPANPHISDDKRGQLSPQSIEVHVRTIKALFGHLARAGLLDKNPLAGLPLPKVPKKLVPTLKPDEIKALLKAVDRETPRGTKYYCLILLSYDSGARVSEVVSMRTADIDLMQGIVKVVGKGQKERLVPFGKHTRKELIRYLKQFREALCEHGSPYLFPKSDGEHISVSSVQQYLRRLAGRAGLKDVRVSPHIFRHSFGTQYLANGGSELALM